MKRPVAFHRSYPGQGVHLRAHTPCQWVPWGVGLPGDSIQAKRQFSTIFWGWQKGGKGEGAGYLNEG